MARQKKPQGTSWRKIQQGTRRTNKTKASRQRQLVIIFRAALAVLLLAAIVVGVLGIRYFFTVSQTATIQGVPLSVDLVFKSDGVLSEQWFIEKFADELQEDARQIDVGQIKEELEASGQIASAVVAVALPSTMTVEVSERNPILRIRIRDENGEPLVLLLARDGSLYRGFGYPTDALRGLPGATGLKIRRKGDGYMPVEGIESVARLLEYAKETLPAVSRHWRVVDLGDWNTEDGYRPSLVRIKSAHIEELVFSVNGIEEQIERLAGILEHTQRYQMGQPVFIDLSYGEEAIIRYK
ncbi:hypothetical protein G0Q06_12565 [Puniceicoccales bacterium CK1056]|uniref:Cell division protein FtsQ n=1 Tax=Oceanipulchritudo coccoides TaxID=2706888 RepID=A0A6B2M6J1_9BACT|nr:hypothetical protein [Oceanipulchritudo coccoides]NDV63290.1 hypothetical protein [Oceanipulchritudo coccoides]